MDPRPPFWSQSDAVRRRWIIGMWIVPVLSLAGILHFYSFYVIMIVSPVYQPLD